MSEEEPAGTVVMARAEHEVAYREIADLIRRHAGTLGTLEMPAIASNFVVGRLVAL